MLHSNKWAGKNAERAWFHLHIHQIRRGTAQLTPCHSRRHGIGHEWRLQCPQGVPSIYETVKKCDHRKHGSSKTIFRCSLFHWKFNPNVHHQQANNTIHLHKTFTCLFLDSEWVCKGWKTLMHLDSISTLLIIISDRSWRVKIIFNNNSIHNPWMSVFLYLPLHSMQQSWH